MPSLSLALLMMAVANTALPERAPDETPTESPVRRAVARSTAFLEKEGVVWMKKQQCASCHHIPVMVWALNEVRNRGYRINEKALGEVTSWALAEGNQAQVFPDLPLDKKRSETDYLGPLLMALGVGTSKDRDVAVEKARHRLLAHAVSQQGKDGSWHANSGGRPPVHASRDVQTSWLLLAMSDPGAAKSTKDPWKSQREAAARWLSRNPPADSHQALAMRLLVYQRLGKPRGDTRPLLESLRRQQNEDGGWSQTRKMKSDAFATGLALYVLSEQKAKGVDEAVRRAQAFLIKTQQSDGSWPMTSRPAEPPPPGPARDLRPIRYLGTAWATIGLVRTSRARTSRSSE
jgi:squalene-hopene/tetraprenyl-beta-curcumene cyclase